MNYFSITLLITSILPFMSQAMDSPFGPPPKNPPSAASTEASPAESSVSPMDEFNKTATLESAMDFIVQHNPDIAVFLSSPDLYRPYIAHLHDLNTKAIGNLSAIIKSRLPKKNFLLTLADTDRIDRYDPRRDNTENTNEFIKTIQNPEYTPTIHSNEQRQKTREAETAVIREYLASNSPSDSDFQKAILAINDYLAKSHTKLPYNRDYDKTMKLIFAFIQHYATHQQTKTLAEVTQVETLLTNSWITIIQRSITSRAHFDDKALKEQYQESIFHIIMMYMGIPDMKKSEQLEAASSLIFANVANNQHIQDFMKMVFKSVKDPSQEPQASSSNSGE